MANRLLTSLILSMMLGLVHGLWPSSAHAGSQPKEASEPEEPKEIGTGKPRPEVPDGIVFVPHDFGAPEVTEAGGVRGASKATIELLAPPILSRSLSQTPTFYWYVDQALKGHRFTLTGETAIEPVLEVMLEPVERAGVFSLSLSAHDIVLSDPGLYRWSVAADLEQDPIVAETVAQALFVYEGNDRDAPADESASSLSTFFAENGYWYDLFDLVSRQVDMSGADGQDWQTLRFDLLSQVGLSTEPD